MYSDGPMAFVAMDAHRVLRTWRPFVPRDLLASQDDANGTGGTDGDDDSVQCQSTRVADAEQGRIA